MPLQALEYGLEVVYRLIGHYKALPRVVLEELAHDIKIVLAGGRALGVVAKWREYAVLPLEPVKYELPELIDLQRVALCKELHPGGLHIRRGFVQHEVHLGDFQQVGVIVLAGYVVVIRFVKRKLLAVVNVEI